MKEKIINNAKTLFKSCTDNKILFERRKNSILIPIIIFIISIFMVTVPSYLSSNKLSSEKVMKNFPYIEEPMKKLLTYSLDCSVEDAQLICADDAIKINEPINVTQLDENGDETVIATYYIMANNSTIKNIDVEYNTPKKTDNIILLLKNYIKIRYIVRDHVNEEIISYEIIGDYSEFEGYNFKEISEKLTSNPELADKEIIDFIYTTYLSTLDTQLLVNLSSSLLSFLFFVLISSLILKGPYLFRRKKGFKFSECLKISLTSSLPALLAGILIYFIFGMDFALVYGIIYIIRIIYIYFKYILSNKNSIFKELYNQTGEERFNI